MEHFWTSKKKTVEPSSSTSGASESASSQEAPAKTDSSTSAAEKVEDPSTTAASSSSSEEESPRSRLIRSATTVKNNFIQMAKPLKTWHQWVLQKVLYNKDYVHMVATFSWIERKTTVKREQILYVIIFLLLAAVLLQNFDPLLCALVSCVYPAYETTRSLMKHKRRTHKQRKHWLIYWIVFSFFTLQDYYTEWLTKLFPPLLLLKMLFLMLLALPQTGVAEVCHDSIVVPVLSTVNDAFTKYNVRQSADTGQVAESDSDAEENEE